jgi:hypothetical protein
MKKTILIFIILICSIAIKSDSQRFDFTITVSLNRVTLKQASELEEKINDLLKEYDYSFSINATKPEPVSDDISPAYVIHRRNHSFLYPNKGQ